MSTTFASTSMPPRTGEPSSSLSTLGRRPPATASASTTTTTATITSAIPPYDPFLLVQRRLLPPPPRPRGLPVLFALAALDLGVTCTLTVLSIHSGSSWEWDSVEWDVIALAVLRICAVVTVGSSVWIRDRVWVVGGVCVLSTLLLIFKSHLIYQKHTVAHMHGIVLHATSLIFSQVHWIAFTVVTADRRRRERLLRRVSFIFEEERPDADEIAAYEGLLDAGQYRGLSNDGDDEYDDDEYDGDPLVRPPRERSPSEQSPLADDSNAGVIYGAV